MRFRPCIDLHDGRVKQIIGSSLKDSEKQTLKTNFSSNLPPSYYAKMYRQDDLRGGHVIMLGPRNEKAAEDALNAWPGGLQVGGSITAENANQWLNRGASHVIVTSYVFRDGIIDESRLKALCGQIGRNRLVLDLSCRWRNDGYYVVTDRWQKFTDFQLTKKNVKHLSGFCDEFLVHAVDIEGKCLGVDKRLLELLASIVDITVTYAGGVSSIADLELIKIAGKERIDVTVGSALDIFGGSGLTYQEVVDYHTQMHTSKENRSA